MRSDEAFQLVGRHQLGKMLGAQSGVVHDLHPNYLHDFRVALRRTRTLLGQLKEVVLPDTRAHFRTEFRWLGEATSTTRDFDVFLEQLPQYARWIPAELEDADEVLEGQFVALRDRSHQRVVEILHTSRYRSLVRDWQSFLAAPLPHVPQTRAAARPIADLARRRMRRQTRRILGRCGDVGAQSTDAELHELRITFKKLRYLWEFFGDLYPDARPLRRIARLKKVQDDLGAIHDHTVHRALLLRLAGDPAASRAPAALIASGQIVAHLERRFQEDVDAFLSSFQAFCRRKNRKRFLALD